MKPTERNLLLVVIGTALLTAILLFVHRVMTNGDNLDYLFIAGSILRGDWAEPFSWRFPVGYPFLVAGFCELFGISIGVDPFSISSGGIYAVKLLGVGVSVLAVWGVWAWSRYVAGEGLHALAVTALFATTQHMAPVYSIIGTEPYFIALSMLALWAWEKVLTKADGSFGRGLASAALLTIAAFLFRQLALAIPVAVLAASLFGIPADRRRRAVAALSALVLLAGGVLMTIFSNASHIDQLADSGAEAGGIVAASKVDLLLGNARAYAMTIPEMVLPRVFGDDGALVLAHVGFAAIPLGLLVYMLLLSGVAAKVRARGPGFLSMIYVGVYVTVVLLWPYRDERFFIPLIPVLCLLVLCGFEGVSRQVSLSEPAQKRAVVAVLVLLLTWQIGTNLYAGVKNLRVMHDLKELPAWHPDRYERTGEPDFMNHLACGLWLADHAEPGSRIYANKAMFITLSSGLQTYYLNRFIAESSEGHAHYVVIDLFPVSEGYGGDKLTVGEMIADRPDAYRLVHETKDGVKVYKFEP